MPEGHFEKAREEFIHLRRNGINALQAAHGPAPRFDGYGLRGFDGETSTLRDAMDMLKKDLERLLGHS
jgi:hypothetical protein